MLEHDAKGILAAHGLPVPDGVLVEAAGPAPTPPFPPPWFVKAQVPAGGRGKAGGIVRADDPAALEAALARLGALRIAGHAVRECRIESAVPDASEAYLSLSVEPRSGGIAVLASAEGGIEVESAGGVASEVCERAPAAIAAAVATLARAMPDPVGPAVAEAGARLAEAFCAIEATQVEINPLLVLDDGSWVLGDAKVILDQSAFARRPELADLVRAREDAYPEAALKLAQDFDYVELDADGEVGFVTTGAGLSMQLVDELLERGIRPFNFCDIRSGTFRGDPGRLIWVMRRIAAGRSIRAVLVNIFAGVTHLGELAGLLLAAREAVPELTAPMVVRLVGNGLDDARTILADAGPGLTLVTDLEEAVDRLAAEVRPA